jgi:hypothetical protein
MTKALLFLMLAATTSAAAQAHPTYWGFVGLGVGQTDRDSTFYAAGVGAGLQRRNLIFMARIASVGPEKQNRMEDLGVLVGVATKSGRPLHFLVAAGIGTAHDPQSISAIALPVEAQATWRFSRWGGVGVRGFLSVNKLSNFGGLTLHAQVGRLR